MLVQRDVTASAYWRSEYLCLAKLLTQAVSSQRVISYACKKRCRSCRGLGVKIPMSGKIADLGGELSESC